MRWVTNKINEYKDASINYDKNIRHFISVLNSSLSSEGAYGLTFYFNFWITIRWKLADRTRNIISELIESKIWNKKWVIYKIERISERILLKNCVRHNHRSIDVQADHKNWLTRQIPCGKPQNSFEYTKVWSSCFYFSEQMFQDLAFTKIEAFLAFKSASLRRKINLNYNLQQNLIFSLDRYIEECSSLLENITF